MTEKLNVIYEQFCNEIETWSLDSIKNVFKELKKINKEDQLLLKNKLDEIYQPLIKGGLDGKTYNILSNLPEKWKKMDATQRCHIIQTWPKNRHFFCNILDLNGIENVDRWRDARYANQFNNFPYDIGQLKGITELYLNYQQINEFPECITDLKELEILSISGNKLKELPVSFLKLEKLSVLNLSINYNLSKIPDLGKLTKLEELNLRYTKIEKLSECFFDLKNLKILFTADSDLDKDTTIIKRLLDTFPNTKIFSLAKKAVEIENNTDFDEFKGKEKIKIDNFELNKIPETLFHADIVKELDIRCPELKSFSDEIGKLTTLEKVRLDIPEEIEINSLTELKNLKHLHLDGIQLPNDIGKLISLETLFAEHITAIPKSINKLKKLKSLELNYPIKLHLTFEMSQLESLEKIDYTNASFINYPDKLYLKIDPNFNKMKCLKEVRLQFSTGEVDEQIFNLPKQLEVLDIEILDSPGEYHTTLSITQIFNHFSALKTLKLQGMKLTSSNEFTMENHPLSELRLRNVDFRKIPTSFKNLKKVWYGYSDKKNQKKLDNFFKTQV